MSDNIKKIVQEIEDLKQKLNEEIIKQEDKIAYKLKNGKIRFSRDILSEQKESVTGIFSFFKDTPFLYLLSSPIVYMMIVPAVILDIFLFFYVHIIFPIYKFPKIKRSDYIVFDRQYLGYLNFIEKVNCMYCSYFNGLMNYCAVIAGRSELYFCPIKHAKKIAYRHPFYYDFLPYGDSKLYKTDLKICQEKAQK